MIGRESYAADMLHCAFLVANGPLDPSRPEYKDCTSATALPSDTPAAFRTICASVLHRLLFRRQGLSHVVDVHAPVRQRRSPPPWRNASRRAVGGVLMGEKRVHPPAPGSTDPTRRSGLLCTRPWRISHRAAYTGSSRDQVTRFSWISRKRSSTPWTKCSASFTPGRSLETIRSPQLDPPRFCAHRGCRGSCVRAPGCAARIRRCRSGFQPRRCPPAAFGGGCCMKVRRVTTRQGESGILLTTAARSRWYAP